MLGYIGIRVIRAKRASTVSRIIRVIIVLLYLLHGLESKKIFFAKLILLLLNLRHNNSRHTEQGVTNMRKSYIKV